MRVLHVDTGTGWRGGQQQVFWLMEELRKQGCEQKLLAPAGSPLATRIRQAGMDVTELRRPAVSFANFRTLRRALAGFDLLHAHDSHAHSLAALAVGLRRGRGCPLVVSRRVAFPISALGFLQYSAADAYLAVSGYVRDRLLDARVPARKIHVVHDGVRVPPCASRAEDRAQFRREHGIGEETLLLGTLTSMAPEKLLGAELDLLAELPSCVHLWLARPAAEERRGAEGALEESARARGLDRRFRIHPLEDGAGAFLAALDLFVYLSESEGLGSAILLAMAHGLPVVASRVGGIPEIVRHDETGLLVGPDLQKDLAPAARRLLDSEAQRRRLGEAARQFVLAHATCERMAAQTLSVYEELLERLPPA